MFVGYRLNAECLTRSTSICSVSVASLYPASCLSIDCCNSGRSQSGLSVPRWKSFIRSVPISFSSVQCFAEPAIGQQFGLSGDFSRTGLQCQATVEFDSQLIVFGITYLVFLPVRHIGRPPLCFWKNCCRSLATILTIKRETEEQVVLCLGSALSMPVWFWRSDFARTFPASGRPHTIATIGNDSRG